MLQHTALALALAAQGTLRNDLDVLSVAAAAAATVLSLRIALDTLLATLRLPPRPRSARNALPRTPLRAALALGLFLIASLELP